MAGRTPSDRKNLSAASLCYGDPDISDFTYDVFFFRVPLNPTDLSEKRFTREQRNYIKWFRLASIINYHGAPQKDERESTSAVADQELQKSPAQETEAVEKEIPARKSICRHEVGSVHQEHAAEERATDQNVAANEERESIRVANQELRESPTQENEAVEKESSSVGESVQENTAEERETNRKVAAKEERESAPVPDREPQKPSTPEIEAVDKESSAGEIVQENTAEERETDRKVAAKEERESAPVADQEPQKSSSPEIEAVENETLTGEDQKSTGVGETTVQEDVQEERETDDQKVAANEERENQVIPAINLQDPDEFPSLRKYDRITKKEKRGEFQRLRGQSKP
ncbi:hypothetical protein OROHE_011608 [Orobanche hederae]